MCDAAHKPAYFPGVPAPEYWDARVRERHGLEVSEEVCAARRRGSGMGPAPVLPSPVRTVNPIEP